MSWFDDIRLGDHPLETQLLDPDTGEVRRDHHRQRRPDRRGRRRAELPRRDHRAGRRTWRRPRAGPAGQTRRLLRRLAIVHGQGPELDRLDDPGLHQLPRATSTGTSSPDVRAGSRITVDLTNLPLDADLVLYGPSGISSRPDALPERPRTCPAGSSRTRASASAGPRRAIASQALNDLQLDQGYDDPFIGDPGPTHIPAMTPLSISQHHGTDPESVGVIAPVDGNVRHRRDRLQRRDVQRAVPPPRARLRRRPARRSCPPRTFDER